MTLLIVLLVLLPGAAATLAVFKPGQASLPTQVACVFGLGQVALSCWALLLVVLRVFNEITFLVGIVVITVALVVAGLRRGRLRDRTAAIVESVRGNGLATALGFIVITVFAVALVRGLTPFSNFGVANPFRYWADGLEIASAGRVPDASVHWGLLFPPTVSKLSFNALNGGFSFLVDNPLGAMGPLLAITMVGAAFGGWALGRELGLNYLAPLVTLLSGPGTELFKRSLIVSPQGWYAGETFARLALITGMVLTLNALREGNRPAVAVAAGAAFGVAGTTHLVPTIVGLGLIAGYAVLRILVERSLGHTLRVAAVTGGVFVVIMLSGPLLSGGTSGFNSVRGDSPIDTADGTFDPTRYFATASVDQSEENQPGPRAELYDGWYYPPGVVFDDFVAHTVAAENESGAGVPAALPVAIAGALAITLLFLAPRDLRPLAPSAFIVWLGILGVSLGMSYLYETYVPAAFPQRRLWSYDTFLFVLIGLSALETLLFYLGRMQRWASVIAGSLIVILAFVASLPPSVSTSSLRRGRTSLMALNWISENLPCDARILANQRTAGTFQAVTGRTAKTEGMAPFLRPSMLNRVTGFLLEVRAFFRAPLQNQYVLDKYGIDHVVVAKRRTLLDARPPLLGHADPAKMEKVDRLERIHRSNTMDVYRVGDADTSAWETPGRHAGFDCRTTPIDPGAPPSSAS